MKFLSHCEQSGWIIKRATYINNPFFDDFFKTLVFQNNGKVSYKQKCAASLTRIQSVWIGNCQSLLERHYLTPRLKSWSLAMVPVEVALAGGHHFDHLAFFYGEPCSECNSESNFTIILKY
jgi:hypothetical protein